LDVLRHGFFCSGDDFNVIAAIVYFLHDTSVRAKYATARKNIEFIVFDQTERVDLFNRSPSDGNWHYCHSLDFRGYCGPFRKKLCEEAARDGFEIQFVDLTGPDHLGTVMDEKIWRGRTIVVGFGHPERTRLRAETKTGLRRLHSFSDWRMLPLVNVFGLKGMPELLERKIEMLFPEDAVGLPEDAKRAFAVKPRLQRRI
jgi:hypothetical protein